MRHLKRTLCAATPGRRNRLGSLRPPGPQAQSAARSFLITWTAFCLAATISAPAWIALSIAAISCTLGRGHMAEDVAVPMHDLRAPSDKRSC